MQGDVDNETEERLEFCLGDLEVGDGIGHGERDLIFCSPLGNYITVPNIYIYVCIYIYVYIYISHLGRKEHHLQKCLFEGIC